MKTLKLFALLFVAVAMSCNFVACGGDDEDDIVIGTVVDDDSDDEENNSNDEVDDSNDNADDPKDPDDPALDSSEQKLIGTWVPVYVEGYGRYWDWESDDDHYHEFAEVIVDVESCPVSAHIVTLRKDHTLIYEDELPYGNFIEGSWSLEDDELTLNATYFFDDSDDFTYRTVCYKIKSLSASEMVWEYYFLLERDEELYYLMTCRKRE